MKKITFLILAVLFVGTLFAQNIDKKWAIGLGVGASFNLDNPNPDKNSMLNGYLSRYLNPSFDIMLDNRVTFAGNQWFGLKGPVGESFLGDSADIVNPLLNFCYKFNNGYILDEDFAVQPFLIGGVGYIWKHPANGFNLDGGAGVKFKLNRIISLTVSGTYIKSIDANPNADLADDHWQMNGVIEFALGKIDMDEDGDGIKDKIDECPNTPAGVAVDGYGCPSDRDGDGIPNIYDNCPDEAGLDEFNGCPDRDGDGIPDKNDNCPDEPGSTKFKGCPDSEDDGN